MGDNINRDKCHTSTNLLLYCLRYIFIHVILKNNIYFLNYTKIPVNYWRCQMKQSTTPLWKRLSYFGKSEKLNDQYERSPQDRNSEKIYRRRWQHDKVVDRKSVV